MIISKILFRNGFFFYEIAVFTIYKNSKLTTSVLHMSKSSNNKPLVKFYEELNIKIEEFLKEPTKKAKKEPEKNNNSENKENNTNTENVEIIIDPITTMLEFIDLEVKLTLLAEYDYDYKLFSEIFGFLNEIPPNILSFILIKNIEIQLNELNQFLTIIRTAENVSKTNKLAENVMKNANKIVKNYELLIVAVTEKHKEVIDNYKESILNSPEINEFNKSLQYFEPVEFISNLNNDVDIINYINLTKEMQYTLAKKRSNTLFESKCIQMVEELKSIIKKKKKDKKYITIKEIISLNEFNNIKYYLFELIKQKDSIIKVDDLNPFIIYILIKTKLIVPLKQPFFDSLTSKKIRINLDELIKQSTLGFFKNLIGKYTDKFKLNAKNINKMVPKIILLIEKDLEQETQILEIDEIGKRNHFKQKIIKIYDYINRYNDWLLSIQNELKPFGDVIRKNLKINNQLRDELDRKNDEYVYYIDSIIEQNIRSQLDTEINTKIDNLETLLKNYETETSKIVLNEIPQAKKISEILDNFEDEFKGINGQVNSIFESYKKSSQINIYDSMKRWEDSFSEIKNRVHFVVTTLFQSFFDKFKSVIEKEQNFFSEISAIPSSSSTVAFSLSIDMLVPEKLNEKQLRERLNAINKKIDEINSIKKVYEEEKSRYESVIEIYLKERGGLIQGEQCVICHKPVDIVNDHFIKCDFCSRIMHYLCGAWWLEKHNTCPVCNNSYVIPNSGMFQVDEQYEDYLPEDIFDVDNISDGNDISEENIVSEENDAIVDNNEVSDNNMSEVSGNNELSNKGKKKKKKKKK